MAHGDVPGLARALTELIESPSLRQTLGAAAYAYVHAHLSLTRMTTEYERLDLS